MLKREDMLCFSLGVAMRRISRAYSEALAEHDITPPQLILLICCLDSSSLTGLLDRTEKIGLLIRRPDPDDRRSLRIHLTEIGRRRLQELEPIVAQLQEQIEREFFAGYKPEEVKTFLTMLQSVQEELA